MSGRREQRIRECAYTLWEADGSPEGREQDYWLRAERLLADEPEAADMTDKPPL